MLVSECLVIKNISNKSEASVRINEESFFVRIGPFNQEKIYSVRIEFILKERPIAFRDHDYVWKPCTKLRISNPISPKILKFPGGAFLMANKYLGTWVYDPKTPNLLEWRIWGADLSPTFHYGADMFRHWYQPEYPFTEEIEVGLIETQKPLELSRSKIPFSPVIVFTDHCDFDSQILLEKQREFFKERSIKVTKGFFTCHFSKKGDWNASMERNEAEYIKWVQDGHELAYHSLSQSILRDKKEEKMLFTSFKSPQFAQVKTWIDHGYQPYNWTFQVMSDQKQAFQTHLKDKGICLAWSYYDSSEACWNLNQNNYQLSSSSKIMFSKLNFLDKLRVLLYYNGSDTLIVKYRKIAPLIKEGVIIQALRLLNSLSIKLGKDDYIKRVQIFFNIGVLDFSFFQTLAIKDWYLAFGKPLDNLIKEKGVAILHTYFSFTEKHHHNPLFEEYSTNINTKVIDGFNKLAYHIDNKNLWNPVLSEFYEHIKMIQKVNLESDKLGKSEQFLYLKNEMLIREAE